MGRKLGEVERLSFWMVTIEDKRTGKRSSHYVEARDIDEAFAEAEGEVGDTHNLITAVRK